MSITTPNPKNRKRAKKHGFLSRSATPGGKSIIRRRRARGRQQISG